MHYHAVELARIKAHLLGAFFSFLIHKFKSAYLFNVMLRTFNLEVQHQYLQTIWNKTQQLQMGDTGAIPLSQLPTIRQSMRHWQRATSQMLSMISTLALTASQDISHRQIWSFARFHISQGFTNRFFHFASFARVSHWQRTVC